MKATPAAISKLLSPDGVDHMELVFQKLRTGFDRKNFEIEDSGNSETRITVTLRSQFMVNGEKILDDPHIAKLSVYRIDRDTYFSFSIIP